MGTLQPNGCHLNGLTPNRTASVTKVLNMERWTRAEERTAELIARIQPDRPSWESRNAVASYVRHLITQSIPCVVFTYGSVPLKTYLPDGDIDLTVFTEDESSNGNCSAEVRDILEKAGQCEDAEYQIKEVQLIPAEVKVVKCVVENIIVDISFSQLGGLCTLCFLEQVDEHINQNHLFKRSIILIKAWCYYESRLLGAYHGLISTYALETLILYIFHVYNNSFAGPLEVLFRFLEFFSVFDWDNFCVSLQGPVPIKSLPNMTADPPRKDDGPLFLSKWFLDTCSFNYSVCPSTSEIKEQFGSKHFNVIDFLRRNNNLGRSVSRGNFFRIRSAFTFGAKRLAGLLDCPKENVVTELNHFFVNTWDMNGGALRPDTHFVRTSGFGNWCQMKKGEEIDDPGFWFYGGSSYPKHNPENRLLCSEYYIERTHNPASALSNDCFRSKDTKQCELIRENGDSVGRRGGGKELLCSSGKWKDGSPLMRDDQLYDQLLKAFTAVGHKPTIEDSHFQSHTNVFEPFCHGINGGKEDGDPMTSMSLYPCRRQTAVNNPSLFPVGPAVPCVATLPNLKYTYHGEGNRKIKLSDNTSGYPSESKECRNDMLRGDLTSHLSNMLSARDCQNSKFLGQGRRLSPAVNHSVLPESSLVKWCPKGIPRYGIRRHSPNPKIERSSRDFQCSSTRNQNVNYRCHRKEQHKEQEVGVLSHHWENPDARFAARNHMQWIAVGEQPSFTQAKRNSDRLP